MISGYHLFKFLKIYHFADYKSNMEHKEDCGINGMLSVYRSNSFSFFIIIIRITYLFIG